MRTLRSRIAAAVVIGAATVIPPAAGTASASGPLVDIRDYEWVGGASQFRQCESGGPELFSEGWQNYCCKDVGGSWQLWALRYKDQPPAHA
ncbi:hypothetical protein [Streptomyces sp. B3I8]|jgi:hypothetical protein|uniref:hypothetical protein n=1 Tax=Streptomyces sp. B3I8 TaxID=3042303 RepID=UPI00278B50B1|nr:hypothetical protein [Streptomyces sp. B3I8]MDQ0790300.1 hypothetical protein [Streptomyces sp. B3I8]